MGAIRLLVADDLLRISRNVAALLTIIVVPFLLAVIAGTSSLAAQHPTGGAIVLAVAPSRLPSAFSFAAAGSGGAPMRSESAAAAERDVRSGAATAAIIAPIDPKQPVRVVADAHARIATDVATSLAATIAVSGRHAALPPVDSIVASRRPLSGLERYGPIVAVFFVLFGVGFVSRSLQLARLDGTLARLLASPIRPGAVLAAKVVVMFCVGVVEVVGVIIGTTLLFGARWGDPVAVALVVVVFVLAIVGFSLFVAGLAISPNSAQAIDLTASLLLVALGGHMVPTRNLPHVLQTVSRFTPNGAAIDALLDIASGARGVHTLAGPFAILASFAAAALLVGGARARKVLVV